MPVSESTIEQHVTTVGGLGRRLEGLFRSWVQRRKESAALDHAKMECREVQDEYEVHVAAVGRSHTPLYLRIRFALLASSRLPSPLGILAWSVLHVLLVVVATLYFLSVVILMLIWDIVFHFFIVPVFFTILALWDIVLLIIVVFVKIRDTASCEPTPEPTEDRQSAAYSRLGRGPPFYYFRIFLFYNELEEGSSNMLVPFRSTLESIHESWSGAWKLQLGRWCREIVWPTTTLFVSE
ncbi:hypothetical protein M758_2G116900 [Ceratodon purpureus]|nr:hypothetical protein M758_2G116900 [Ceratodon purpureus]